MWDNDFESVSDEELEALELQGVTISIADLQSQAGISEYRKAERYEQWKEIRKAMQEARKALKEYEALIGYKELNQFRRRHQKETGEK